MLKVTARTSKQELLDYAESELGVKLDESKLKDDLVAEIRELEKEAGIVQDEPQEKPNDGAPDEETAVKNAKAEPGKKPKAAVVLIHQPQAPDEESEPDTHCVLGLNGRFYQVKYGEEVEVPYGIYDILKNCKQTKYFAKKNPQTGQTEQHSKVVQRYPFSLIRLVY
uniref:hypothetical protein n=1 Tax=Rheinheimera sp. TaxID=1869214 RepID=UPI00404888C2